MKKGKVNTELGAWLKAANKGQQQELCEKAGVSMAYLRLLSNAHRENPKVRLALSLVHEANKISVDHNTQGVSGHMPYLTVMGLAEPTRRGDRWTVVGGFINE